MMAIVNFAHFVATGKKHSKRNFQLRELAASIAEYGLFEPILAQPDGKGGYLILAGKNRTAAVRLNGETEIKAFVCNVDEAQAVMLITDSNLQHRDRLLPSERGFAYRLQLEALRQKGGRRKDNGRQNRC